MSETTTTAEWTDETETEEVNDGQAVRDEGVPDGSPEVTEEPGQEDPETFPKEYVVKLRREAADARVKAKRADDLAASLFTERVRATGRMADPSDLPFNADLLDDPDALTAAIDTLLANKPHLASRTPRGNVGQGTTGSGGDVDLAAMLRMGA